MPRCRIGWESIYNRPQRLQPKLSPESQQSRNLDSLLSRTIVFPQPARARSGHCLQEGQVAGGSLRQGWSSVAVRRRSAGALHRAAHNRNHRLKGEARVSIHRKCEGVFEVRWREGGRNKSVRVRGAHELARRFLDIAPGSPLRPHHSARRNDRPPLGPARG